MYLYAHRGYSERYPENTMLAFEQAISAGFDGIETDVHLTKDNQLVLIHDEKIDRTSNGTGFVKDMTLAELREYNYNNHFKDITQTIPTLVQLLELVKQTKIELNIEIKTDKIHYPQIEAMTYQLVKQYGLLDRVKFSSFNLDSLVIMRQIDKQVYLGYLYEEFYRYPEDKYLAMTSDLQAAHPKNTMLTAQEVDNYHHRGLEVNTWTVDSQYVANQLKAMGVDIVISNRKLRK